MRHCRGVPVFAQIAFLAVRECILVVHCPGPRGRLNRNTRWEKVRFYGSGCQGFESLRPHQWKQSGQVEAAFMVSQDARSWVGHVNSQSPGGRDDAPVERRQPSLQRRGPKPRKVQANERCVVQIP